MLKITEMYKKAKMRRRMGAANAAEAALLRTHRVEAEAVPLCPPVQEYEAAWPRAELEDAENQRTDENIAAFVEPSSSKNQRINKRRKGNKSR